jgi:hypothetical protein
LNKRSTPEGREELFIKEGLPINETILYTELRNAGHTRAFAERYENVSGVGIIITATIYFFMACKLSR